MPERVRGLGVSSGVAVGRAFLLHAEPLPVVPRPIPPERVPDEIERFRQAVVAADHDLELLKAQVREALGEPYAGIFEAHRLILNDPTLKTMTEQRIRMGRVDARWAVKEVIEAFAGRFDAVDDEYLRERGRELLDVQRRLQRLLRGEPSDGQTLPAGPVVVVAHAVGPSDTLLLARREVAGLATDVGGRTSHTAILAQALSLPAVVGLRDFSTRVPSGAPIILDGETGEVTVAPGPGDTADAELRRRESIARESEMLSARDLPPVTRDGTEIVIRANVEFPSEVQQAKRFGAQGIGLYRSEFLFLSRSPAVPTEEEHFETYLEIARGVAPYPAVIRTLDLGGEKQFSAAGVRDERNPVLGLRGVRFCLRHPELFRPQLRGLLRAAAEQSNLRILLPLVTGVDEIQRVRTMILEQKRSLRQSGRRVPADVPLGIMVEVPAVAIAADLFAPEVDFFSIGTNDLIQYTLAVDRGSEAVAGLYRPLHPGVLRMLKLVVDSAERHGVPVALCGEMAADPLAIGLLVGLGLRELSVQPRAVGAVREAVRALSHEEARRRVAHALERSTATEAEPGPPAASG